MCGSRGQGLRSPRLGWPLAEATGVLLLLLSKGPWEQKSSHVFCDPSQEGQTPSWHPWLGVLWPCWALVPSAAGVGGWGRGAEHGCRRVGSAPAPRGDPPPRPPTSGERPPRSRCGRRGAVLPLTARSRRRDTAPRPVSTAAFPPCSRVPGARGPAASPWRPRARLGPVCACEDIRERRPDASMLALPVPRPAHGAGFPCPRG